MKAQAPDHRNPEHTPQIVGALRVYARPIDDVRPQARNPRLGDVDTLRGSLRLFGQRPPDNAGGQLPQIICGQAVITGV